MPKPTLADLRNALVAVLTDATVTRLLKAPYVYEVYVLDLVGWAAQLEGGHVQVMSANLVPAVAPYTFRQAGSRLAPAGSSFVHLDIEFPSADLEAHQGIYVAGRSLQRHQCDASVVKKEEAHRVRRIGGADPRARGLVFTGEAKLYQGSIGIDLAREFAGLQRDLGLGGESLQFVTNSSTHLVDRYLSHLKLAWADDVRPRGRRTMQFVQTVRTVIQRFLAGV